MNKILLSIFIFTFLSLGYSEITTEAKTKTEIIPQDQPPSVMEGAFLRYLGETILDIMSSLMISSCLHLAELKRYQRTLQTIHMMSL